MHTNHRPQDPKELDRPDEGLAAKLRVIVADGDPLARGLIVQGLRDSGRFVVVATAADGVEALELASHYRPELLVTEATLPRVNGIELTRRVTAAAPEVGVVLLTVFAEADLALAALRAGAKGVLSKEIGMEALSRALVGVHQGEAAVSRLLIAKLVEQLQRVPEPGRGLRPVHSTLTTREWEVLDLLSSGAGTAEVADRLVVTEDTVYSHVKSLMRKLGVRTRAEAIAAARELVQQSAAA
jgi:two-component system nitrate/nitrite response regulator NarL